MEGRSGDDRLRDAALEALERYRGRATGAESAGAALVERAGEAEDAPRRRLESIEWAESELDIERGFATLIHDIAREEGLEPAFAYELVRCGVGVLDLAEPTADETTVDGPPEWIAPPHTRGTSASRERSLRSSFRRLRGHLERADSTEAALAAFVAEPDVGSVRY